MLSLLTFVGGLVFLELLLGFIWRRFFRFGDLDVKSDGKPVVICTPNGAGLDNWASYKLSRGKTTWMVLASDGLWDFASDASVMSIVLKQVR